MIELAAFLFQTLDTRIGRLASFRRAPVASAISVLVILGLLWMLVASWIDMESAQTVWIARPFIALEEIGLHPGAVFTALLVAAIPAYCMWPKTTEDDDGEKGDK